MKTIWLLSGVALTTLAVIGALLPVMPSTVFAIGAAACFGRSSRRLERQLLANRWLGPAIADWRRHGAIPAAAKVAALASMAVSGTTVALTAPIAVTAGVLVLLAASAAFVASRPSIPTTSPETRHAP